MPRHAQVAAPAALGVSLLERPPGLLNPPGHLLPLSAEEEQVHTSGGRPSEGGTLVLCALVLAGGGALAGVVWPLRLWPGQTESGGGDDDDDSCAHSITSRTTELVIGSAPVWLRNALLGYVAARIVRKLSGFGQQSSAGGRTCVPKSCTGGGKGQDAQSVADAEADLGELLTQGFPDEARRQRVLDLVQEGKDRVKLQVTRDERGILKTLLTGHGIYKHPPAEAGWMALANPQGAQPDWHKARMALGLTWQQGVGVSMTKLLLWHCSQPLAYLWVFDGYYCNLNGDGQRQLGQIVAAREVLYLTTLGIATIACPVFLLLDLSRVWGEADSRSQRMYRIACYILGPHNYVALCLAKRFQDAAGGKYLRWLFLGLAGLQILADFASCFALAGLLGEAKSPPALKIGYGVTGLGFLLFFGPASVLKSFEVAQANDTKTRVRAVGGLAMLAGLVYVAIGVILQLCGVDIVCNGYTFGIIAPDCGGYGCSRGICQGPGFGQVVTQIKGANETGGLAFIEAALPGSVSALFSSPPSFLLLFVCTYTS
jgi:hypothetical protein